MRGTKAVKAKPGGALIMMIWLGKLLGIQDQQKPQCDTDEEKTKKKIDAATLKISKTVVVFGVVGVGAIAIWAWGVITDAAGSPGFAAYLGTDLLVAAAATAAAALLGFVFGIPLTPEASIAAGAPGLATNTNLERISNWLTTLLIGATLVQIKDIAQWVGSLGKSLIATGPAANDAVVPIIVIYFFALSFLGVYLITRLYLTSALDLLAGGARGELKNNLDASAAKALADRNQSKLAELGEDPIKQLQDALAGAPNVAASLGDDLKAAHEAFEKAKNAATASRTHERDAAAADGDAAAAGTDPAKLKDAKVRAQKANAAVSADSRDFEQAIAAFKAADDKILHATAKG
jgi:hypothetical protein